MRPYLLHFLFMFTVTAGMWMLIEYADSKQLSEADFWYSLGFGLVSATASLAASIGIRWWEKRRESEKWSPEEQ